MTAEEFRTTLNTLGLRQIELADLLGVHRSAVGKWVRGRLPVPRYVELLIDVVERNIELRRRLVAAGLEAD